MPASFFNVLSDDAGEVGVMKDAGYPLRENELMRGFLEDEKEALKEDVEDTRINK